MERPEVSFGKNSTYTFFFSILIFLCCADRFFAFRIDNYNLRIGQLVLLFALVPIAYLVLSAPTPHSYFLKIIKNWIPFFLAYAIAAAMSPDPGHTFLKLLWSLFNIGGAALLLLGTQHWENLKKGLFYAMGAIALLIWVQFILLYCFGLSGWFEFLSITAPDHIPWFHKLLGFAQPAAPPIYQGLPLFRPHAFYYEPSYAACALAFAFPLCLGVIYKKEILPWKSTFMPALIFGAIFITTARSGILGIGIGTLAILFSCLLKRQMNLLKSLFRILIISVLFFAIFSPFPKVQTYASFFTHDLGPSAVATRIHNPISSEGWRLANTLDGIHLWEKHPLLGEGIPPIPEFNRGLGLTCQNMWIEILVESGAFGFLAFLFGLGKSIRDSIGEKTDFSLVILIMAALTAHFLVNMSFTSTFPRLDYWLLFFFALRLALENQKAKNRSIQN